MPPRMVRAVALLTPPALLITACATGRVPSQTVGSQDARDGVRAQAVFGDLAPDAPGCAVGVYRDDQVVLTQGFGLASVEDGRRITPRTTFDLGSGSKAFTALAVFLLEERGRLALDDDVRRHVPELPDYGTPIRIRDLLQHTSGLRDYEALDAFAGRETETTGQFLALLASQRRLNFAPGTRHEYSHSDFALLGVIVERAAGEPFGAFVEREVLWPLGMRGSRVYDARGPRVPERAFGHARADSGLRVTFNRSELVGGSNLYTSVADLFHWHRALAEAADGRRPLVARLLTRPTLPGGEPIPYAYGIRQDSYRGLPTLTRGGSSHGTRTEYIRFPGQQFTVAVLCNSAHLWAGQRAERVADAYLHQALEPRRARPTLPPAVPITTADLQRYVGAYQSPDGLDHTRIAVVDGQLVELLGDTAQTFTYRGDGLFSADGIPGDFRLAFAPEAGEVVRLQFLSEGENDGGAVRLPASAVWRPDARALAEYAGTYFSDELDAVWRLAVEDGPLVLRRRGHAAGRLVPTRPDVFSRHFGPWNLPLVASFAFGRDAAGAITHFTITTPAGADVVRDLLFVRVPPS